MRREDVQPLLYRAAVGLSEPDLADAAWAEGLATRRRTRRSILIGIALVVFVAVVAAIGVGVGYGNKAEPTPPPVPTTPSDDLDPSGQIGGIDYWMAPPSGSERFLEKLHTPLGDRLQLPDQVQQLEQHPIDLIAAVVLGRQGDTFRPLLVGNDSTWAMAPVDLAPIATGMPLSSGAVSPNGRLVAFPQPGQLVTVDSATAEVTHYALPSRDIRSVSWLSDSQRVLVSGPGVAYRVLVGEGGDGEQPLTRVTGANDSEAITAPFRLEAGAVLRYMDDGQWNPTNNLQLPVQEWVGQTSTSAVTAARLFIANDLPQVPTKVPEQPQVVAAISTVRTRPSRLLVLGQPDTSRATAPADPNTLREAGCCAVLGWYDDGTVLVQVRGWVLAWDLPSGRVRRVTELAVDGVAVGPGVRP
ncbi:hypothetical protein [Kribbella sp. NPDC055071]